MRKLNEKTRTQQEFKYWKNRAERFENLYHLRKDGIEKLLHEAYPYLRNVKGHIVDIGCGTGTPSSILARKLGKNVIGTDFSKSMLKLALKRIEHHVRADALHLAFPNNSLGAIVCITVLTDYTDKKPFLKEFYSCLRKDGIYVHADYSLNDGYWNLNERTYPLAFSSEFKLSRESIEETQTKLVEEGFTILNSNSINFKVPMTVNNYLKTVKSRPGSKFELEKEDQIRKTAEKYLLNNELDRELILIVSKKE